MNESLALRTLQKSDTTIESVVDSVLGFLINIDHPKAVGNVWFEKITGIIKYSRSVTIGFEHVRAIALARLKQNWDDIPSEIRVQYGNSFKQCALALCPDWASVTIDNYISVAETWLLSNNIPDKVTVLERDGVTGSPIIENGEYVTKDIPFEPAKIPISKLLAAKGAFRRDEMTPDILEKLADPYFSRDDLSAAISRKVISSGNGLQYFIEGSYIVAKEGLLEVKVCDINFDEYETNELARKCINRLLTTLGIEHDEDAIARLAKSQVIYAS